MKFWRKIRRFLTATPEDPANVIPTTKMVTVEENPRLREKREEMIDWMKSKGIYPEKVVRKFTQ